MPDTKLWGIHNNNEPSIEFVRDGFISVGWDDVGDIRRFGNDREALKAEVATRFPTARPGAIPVWAGVLNRFANVIAEGDLVVHPRKSDRTVNLGIIESGYEFEAGATTQCHRRKVTWAKTGLERTRFSQGALYEIGAFIALFQVQKHDSEFRALIDGSEPTEPGDVPGEEEPVVAVEDEPDAERIIETTRDFILRTLASDLKGHPFAHFVAHLLETMGYRTRVSPEGPDRGVDIVAHKDPLGLEPPIIKVQCKSTEGQVGSPEVSGLAGTLGPTELGLFVALGRFSTDARNLGRDRSNLRLVDGAELVDMILDRYDGFSPEYKAKLPMRRVFVPDRSTAT
jgi:restriction system protein